MAPDRNGKFWFVQRTIRTAAKKFRVPVGGKQLVILNSELRFPLGISAPLIGGTLGGVVFYDAGNVYSNVSFKNMASDLTHTVGFGAALQDAGGTGPH